MMPRMVPSQVCQMIAQLFQDEQPSKPGDQAQYSAARGRALLDLVEAIPDELIHLRAADAASFYVNVSALRSGYETRTQDGMRLKTLPGCSQRPPLAIRDLLARCPDEAPAQATVGLNFIGDAALREELRTDISTASSALRNHEYKPATVLAGSVVEAPLLCALQTLGEMTMR